jgi:tetratricopeptide (TPR) repeat protein
MKPDNSKPYVALGAAYVEMGQTGKAIAALQEAVRLKPSFGAYENLGTVFLNARRFEDSIRCFKKALELDGNDYRAYGNLARAYFWAAGRRELAQETYGRAIALANQKLTVNPQDPDINLNLAVYYAMLGQEDNSLYHWRRSKELQPATGETDFWAGVVNLQLGHKEKALAWIRQAIDLKYFAEINSVPELDGLRSDAEFRRILSGR